MRSGLVVLLTLVALYSFAGGYGTPSGGSFSADGSTAMTGDLNVGGNDVTNATSVMIKKVGYITDAASIGLGVYATNRLFLTGGSTTGGVSLVTITAAGSAFALHGTNNTVTPGQILATAPSGMFLNGVAVPDSSVVTNITRDAWQLAYLLEDVSGTATVSRTVGGTNYAEFITLADTATTLKVDTSTFPTNGGAVFAWSLNPNGQVISVDSSSIDTSSWASVTLVTNEINSLIFYRPPYRTLFKVQGE